MKRKLVLVLAAIFVVVAVFAYMANLPQEKVEVSVRTHTYGFLIDEGFTPVQASGILANIKLESNFNPTATSIDGLGFGMLQWTGIRRERLEQFAEEIGKPVDEVDTQLMFLVEEINPDSEYYTFFGENSYQGYQWTDFLDVTNPRDAAKAFSMVCARPSMSRLELLGDIAVDFWELYNSLN